MRFLKIKTVPILFWSAPEPLTFRPPVMSVGLLVIGLVIFGLGEALLISSGAGVSPWTVFEQGVSLHTEWSIGFATFVISALVLLLWIPLRQKPGMGTILNIIIISVVLDVALPFLPRFDSLGLRLAEAAAGVVVTGIGGGIYLIANLGPGPRDGLMTGLQRVTGFPIANVRGAIEVSVVIIGWLLGGVVGAGCASDELITVYSRSGARRLMASCPKPMPPHSTSRKAFLPVVFFVTSKSTQEYHVSDAEVFASCNVSCGSRTTLLTPCSVPSTKAGAFPFAGVRDDNPEPPARPFEDCDGSFDAADGAAGIDPGSANAHAEPPLEVDSFNSMRPRTPLSWFASAGALPSACSFAIDPGNGCPFGADATGAFLLATGEAAASKDEDGAVFAAAVAGSLADVGGGDDAGGRGEARDAAASLSWSMFCSRLSSSCFSLQSA